MTSFNTRRSIALAAAALVAGLFLGSTNAVPILPLPSVNPPLDHAVGYIASNAVTSVAPKAFAKGGLDGIRNEQGKDPIYTEHNTLADGVLYQGGLVVGEAGSQVLSPPFIQGGLEGVKDATGLD
ncbi:hypothetical protein MVEG_12233 [Podila verticillata NRRL 6337]|uniref:Uncharacterized protein n=1 Tax=Podila verticillata NRRL 6337 TaxID=1069443 RepID=A0A086TIX2_9FUNG|nr:hypothetical protein MVEG_12233 [Podila verticillata NRRL 6337]